MFKYHKYHQGLILWLLPKDLRCRLILQSLTIVVNHRQISEEEFLIYHLEYPRKCNKRQTKSKLKGDLLYQERKSSQVLFKVSL